MGVAGKGRPRKPASLALVSGSRKDRINNLAPIPAELPVEPPEWLRVDAVKVWDHLASDLIAAGVLTGWDVQAFAEWCDAVATIAEAAQHLATDGYLIERPVFDRNGKQTGNRTVPNEWLFIQRAALDTSAKRAARFGLTPAERAALSIPGGDQSGANPDRFLFG